MKYVKAIFENEDIQALATSNEELINLATETLLGYNLAVESYIYNNLEDYFVEGDLAATYESIRNVVLEENLSFIDICSRVVGSDLPLEEKALYFMEVQEASDKPSFVKRHKGKLIALGALAGAGAAGYAAHKGMMGPDAKTFVKKGLKGSKELYDSAEKSVKSAAKSAEKSVKSAAKSVSKSTSKAYDRAKDWVSSR